MYVYNVGQANCILVTTDNAYGKKSAIFFDTGIQNGAEFEGSLIQSHIAAIISDDNIQNVWFILSHTDDDHINIFDNIVKICNVGHKPIADVFIGVNDNNLQFVASKFLPYRPDVNFANGTNFFRHSHGGTLFTVRSRGAFEDLVGEMNETFTQGTNIDFLYPNDGYTVNNANDASLVTKLTYGGRSILFTGDAPGKLLNAICFEKQQLDGGQKIVTRSENNIAKLQGIDILICPHHGSMSHDSYRWRGELNHKEMISIISSSPIGPHKLPERSFMDYTPAVGLHFRFHAIAYRSKLRDHYSYRLTSAPIFVTGCSGIPVQTISTDDIQAYINSNAGIGYHININMEGLINISNISDGNDVQEYIVLEENELETEEVMQLDQSPL